MRKFAIPTRTIVAVLFLLLLLLLFLAYTLPFDPEERRPGTRLSGDWADNPNPDWSFMVPRQKIWLQTSPWYLIPHSVTTVSFVSDNVLYVPCGRCADKRWPRNVAANPDVVVKIGDQLYPRSAVLIEDPQTVRRVLNVEPHAQMPDVALYRMDPR